MRGEGPHEGDNRKIGPGVGQVSHLSPCLGHQCLREKEGQVRHLSHTGPPVVTLYDGPSGQRFDFAGIEVVVHADDLDVSLFDGFAQDRC